MQRTESIQVEERDFESWREIASEILGDAAEWFQVHQRNGEVRLHVTGEIGIGPDWRKLIDAIGNAEKITLEIRDCIGGNSLVAFAFVEAFQGSISQSIIRGKCHSAGVILALAGSRVVMEKSAELLLHSPTTFAYGGATELANQSRALESVTRQLVEMLHRRTELPREFLAGLLDGVDSYLSADAALHRCFVNEVFEDAPEPSLPPAPSVPLAPKVAAFVQAQKFSKSQKFVLDLLEANFRANGKLESRDKANHAAFLNEIFSTITFNSKIEN